MKMNLPQLDLRDLQGSVAARQSFLKALCHACQRFGSFILTPNPIGVERCAHIMSAVKEFFALPYDEKVALDIRHSPHFRGYSEMKNERDWREQFHLGREERVQGNLPAYRILQGPNQWPPDPAWMATMNSFLEEMESVGLMVLNAIAQSIEYPADYFERGLLREPYTLMKLIHYHPQLHRDQVRNGVAPHCDFSWLTVIFQDEVGGLQAQDREENWNEVPSVSDGLLVNLGELLQAVTGGFFFAAPHRVINLSRTRARISIPVFLNPRLDTIIRMLPVSLETSSLPLPSDHPPGAREHVHRVIPLSAISSGRVEPFCFGEAEWKRKGLNIWCTECCSLQL